MKFSAVIFDLDGTLLNTVEDIAYAMNLVLSRNNYPTHTVDKYNYFVGGGLYNLVFQTIPQDQREPAILNRLLEEVMAEYTKCIDTKTKPYAGINELLDNLSDKGIILAILSNKAHQFMEDIVKSHFAKWNFSLVFGARPGVPTKPNPQSAIEIANLMNLSPEQIVYVGDTDVDMKTATSAKMFAVGAAWGFRTEDELLENGARIVIHHPRELLTLFR